MLWVALALIAYAQTSVFDQTIREYAYGPTGWPRAICIGLIIGASGQFLSRLLAMRQGAAMPERRTDSASARQTVRQAAFFLLPFAYLYLTSRIGFYVATPFFIVALLLLLEVRSILVLGMVTACVYGIALLVFTRLFYVALPVGRIEALYDINTAIIMLARSGL